MAYQTQDLSAFGLSNALQDKYFQPGGQLGPIDRKAVMRGHLATGNVDMGALGGAQTGLVGDARNAQFRQQVDLGAAGGFVNPLQAFGLQSLGPQGGGNIDMNQALQAFLASGQQADQALAPQDMSALQQEQLDLLRKQAAPFEQRSFNSLNNSLFSTGRMGTTGGGTQMEAFARGLGQADLSRQLAAYDFARTTSNDTANRALSRFSLAESLFGNQGTARSSALQNSLGALQGLGGVQAFGLNNLNASLAGSQALSNAALGREQTKGPSNFGAVMGGLSAFGEAAGGAAAAYTAFSDPRLKAGVVYLGDTPKGTRLYAWHWNDEAKALGLTGTGIGPMADEVPPELLGIRDGYLTVDYDAIFAEASAEALAEAA